ncbi:hypothetical protein AR685_12685 [Chryseobacterium sp. JAH]|nr:hypothetical protein AR685_12685 [Chryseobacterium sp. JAH]
MQVLIFLSALMYLFLMDSDMKEPSMTMRFTEYFAMAGIIFTVTTLLYFSINFTVKKFKG